MLNKVCKLSRGVECTFDCNYLLRNVKYFAAKKL